MLFKRVWPLWPASHGSKEESYSSCPLKNASEPTPILSQPREVGSLNSTIQLNTIQPTSLNSQIMSIDAPPFSQGSASTPGTPFPSPPRQVAQHPEAAEPVETLNKDILPYAPPDAKTAEDYNILKERLGNMMFRLEQASRERYEARTERLELREKLDELLDTGANLMQKLNELFVQTSPEIVEPLVNLFQQYKQEQDTYLSLEDDYLRLEKRVVHKEYLLETAEGKVTKAFRKIEPDGEGLSTDSSDSDISSESDTSALDKIQSYQPLVANYLSLLGNISLLKEDLWNLRAEYHSLVSEKAARGQFHPILDPKSENFLATFNTSENQLLDELATIEENSNRVRQECIEQGFAIPDEQIFSLGEGPQESDALMNLPVAGHRNEEIPVFFDENSDHSSKQFSVPEYINTWLLHRLSGSTLETNRYESLAGWDVASVDKKKFRLWWFNDGTTTVTQPQDTPQTSDDHLYLAAQRCYDQESSIADDATCMIRSEPNTPPEAATPSFTQSSGTWCEGTDKSFDSHELYLD
ncbi:hypothetical protein FQN52_007054 [Onygenales sp. PD_12]|nr:hypothetical protein FQN52_007054 [Onygenales sp. PD_12]